MTSSQLRSLENIAWLRYVDVSRVPAVRMKSPAKLMVLVVELEPRVRVPELLLTVIFGALVFVSFSLMIAWLSVSFIFIRNASPPTVPPATPTRIRLFFRAIDPVPVNKFPLPVESIVRSLFTVIVDEVL